MSFGIGFGECAGAIANRRLDAEAALELNMRRAARDFSLGVLSVQGNGDMAGGQPGQVVNPNMVPSSTLRPEETTRPVFIPEG